MADKDFQIKITTQANTTGLDRTTEATNRTVGSKNRLAKAFEKLQSMVPGLNFALGSLKNPYVALAAVVALAITQLQKFFAEVERMAEIVRRFDTLNLSIRDFGQVLGKNEAERKKFLRDLQALAEQQETNERILKRITEEIETQSGIESEAAAKRKAAALAGIEDVQERARVEAKFDEEQKQREMDKAKRLATAQENAARRAFAKSEAASAQLPAAEATLNEATVGVERSERMAQAHSDFGAGKYGSRDDLVKKIRGLEEKQSFAGPNQKVAGLEEARSALTDYDATQRNLSRLHRGAVERETVAAEQVGTLRKSVVENYTEGVSLSENAQLGFSRLNAERAAEGGPPALGPGSAQFRYDAQRGAIRNRNTQTGVSEVGDAVSNAVKTLGDVFIKALTQVETDVKRQQSSD